MTVTLLYHLLTMRLWKTINELIQIARPEHFSNGLLVEEEEVDATITQEEDHQVVEGMELEEEEDLISLFFNNTLFFV